MALSDSDKAKTDTLFQYLSEFGEIRNREKFKSLGQRGEHLWEFKSFQIRFLGDFRPGKRFLVAHGCRKKKDELARSEIEKALHVLAEDDARIAREKSHDKND